MRRFGGEIGQRSHLVAPVQHLTHKVIQPQPVTGNWEGGQEEDPVRIDCRQDLRREYEEKEKHWGSRAVHDALGAIIA